MSPASRPRVSGCRASWSRPCRCRQAPVHAGPLQLRRSPRVTQTQDPQPHGAALLYLRPRSPRRRSAAHNSATTASGRSSTGRAPVSKTGGWGFDSLRPCESWKVSRAPDPRPGREASEATWHRANGHMAVGTPLPTQTPAMGSEGELDSGQHQAGAGPALRERSPVAAATHGGDVGDASAAAHASVGQLAGPPGCRPGPLAGLQVRVLPDALAGMWRDQPMAGDGSRLENGRPTRACEFDPRSLRRWKATPGWPGARLLPGSWPRP